MPRLDVQIATPDGHSDATLHIPEGGGPSPGVVVFPDGYGARAPIRQMGDRVADMGYVALVPDIYYRAGDWAPFDPGTSFTDPAERDRLYGYMGTLTNDRIIADANAYTDFLLNRPEVTGAAIGTTGYCFGGRMSMVTAGGLNGKIPPAASFPGGGIAIPRGPSTPHPPANKIPPPRYRAGPPEGQNIPPGRAPQRGHGLHPAA